MENFFTADNGRIYYKDQGKGEIIVLLHGYLETSEIWDSFAGKLAGKYRVVSIDLPGHGKSDVFGEIHSMEFMASVIKELMAGSGDGNFFLAGHSLGGYVTMAFVDLFPQLLKGYCLFHSHPYADPEETLKKREHEISLVKSGRKDLFYPNSIRKMYASVNLEKYSENIRKTEVLAAGIPDKGITAILKGMMQRPSRVAVMEEGKVPLLWILGALDNFINLQQVREGITLPLNARVAILYNSGHMGFIEEESISLQLLEDFIKGK